MTATRYDIQVRVRGRRLVDARDVYVLEGGVTFLFGESGIGKSLVGKALFGLLDSDEYRVHINGEAYGRYLSSPEFAVARGNGFFVFQEPSSHLDLLQTIQAQLCEGDLAKAQHPLASAAELWKPEDQETLGRILPIYPKPYRPSGGEKQRLLCAMAFAKMDAVFEQKEQRGGIFIFDEPTGSLDREARNLFFDRLFSRYRRQQDTMLVITHDYGILGYIQSSHADLLPAIRFREMRLEGDVAQVRAFEPARFFQWLHEQPTLAAESRSDALLRVESGIRIFGKTLDFASGTSDGDVGALRLKGGELVYLKAGSGVGKTTVSKVIMGLQRAEQVRMWFEEDLLSERTPHQKWQQRLWGRRMTMAFQHADEALNPNASVEETLRLLPLPPLQTDTGIEDALKRLFDEGEIARLKKRKVWQLSGGQKQRLNLLRAFALSTPLIILDEPLSALDFESIDRVLALIREALRRGQAILLISHNEDIFDALVPETSVYHLRSSDRGDASNR
jgi:peptide/nickel transport system ATP-binding protein